MFVYEPCINLNELSLLLPIELDVHVSFVYLVYIVSEHIYSMSQEKCSRFWFV